MSKYLITFTDTFGGELNYCFSNSCTVEARDTRHAITLAKQERYYSPVPRHTVWYDDGDMLDFRIVGKAIGGTVEFLEGE